MSQITKIQDKIKCEIETAKESAKIYHQKHSYQMERYYNGKIISLRNLQQWIKDNIKKK